VAVVFLRGGGGDVQFVVRLVLTPPTPTFTHTHSLSLQLDEKLSDFEFPDDFVLDVYEMVNAG